MTDTQLTILLAALPTTISAIAAMIISIRNGQKVQELHILINSNLEEWKTTATKAALAEGHALGLVEGHDIGHAQGMVEGHATALSEERAPRTPTET